jgi:hypothetical protein
MHILASASLSTYNTRIVEIVLITFYTGERER